MNDVFIIQLDRPRELKFNHTAIKTLVAMTGLTMEEFDTELTPANFDLIEKVAYCGLLKDAREHGETLTLEHAVDLLDQAPVFSQALEGIFSAWGAAFGAKPEGNPEQPAKASVKEKRSTGTTVSG